jgi:hypothetical protein
MELAIIPAYRKSDKTACILYKGPTLLSTTYKYLSDILLSKLTPYIDEIEDLQCGFQRNRSITVQTLCTCRMLETKWYSPLAIYMLIACNSVARELVRNIPIDFLIPM